MNVNYLGRFGKKLLVSLIASGLVFVLLVVACIVTFTLILDSNIKNQQELDSLEESINLVYKAVLDLETGQRGYNLTKREVYLELFYLGTEEFTISSKDVKQRAESLPDLRINVSEVIQKGQFWIDNYARPQVEVTRNGGQPTMESYYEGKKALDEFRLSADKVIAVIDEKRMVVRETMRTRYSIAYGSLLMISIGVVILHLCFHLKFLKNIASPIIQLSKNVKSYARNDFSKPIPAYHKNDEIAELLQNVESMRLQLEDRFKMLQFQVNVDALTGIYNRRYFNDLLEFEWVKLKQTDVHISLILFDIDYFKNFNDSYGHIAGDECLKAISNELKNLKDETGMIPTRYGGEEFAIILLDHTEKETMNIAEKIRKSILSLKIPHCDSAVDKVVTVSMGVATITTNDVMEPNDLISVADKALYQSKLNGRNRVTKG